MIHFISGLPRSGSTLLAAILRQNPHFHAGMTSPVGTIFMAVEKAMSRGANEYAGQMDDIQRACTLEGVFIGYYGIADCGGSGDIVFDTNRMWTAKLPVLATLFPKSKVICCVRNLAWIMDSLERQVRRNPLELSGIYGFDPKGSVYSRTAALAASTGMVGSAYDALREGFFGEHKDRLLLIDYEALATEPQRAIDHIYDFIGEPAFEHDFRRVEDDDVGAREFDISLGAPDLHDIRPRVELIERETILPPDLFERFQHDSFWQGHPWRHAANVVLPRD